MRTNWTRLVDNLNRSITKDTKTSRYLNRVVLSQKYSLFIERDLENKKNVFLREKEFIKKYGKENVEKYREEKKSFLSDVGINQSYGSFSDIDVIAETQELIRQKEVNLRDFGGRTYGESREWSSDEWKAFNEFKKQMTSDEAAELTFAILDFNENPDRRTKKGRMASNTINKYYEKGDKTLKSKISDFQEYVDKRSVFELNEFLGIEI